MPARLLAESHVDARMRATKQLLILTLELGIGLKTLGELTVLLLVSAKGCRRSVRLRKTEAKNYIREIA